VVEQLEELLPDSSELSVVLSRAEFETTGGIPAIAEAFPIKAVYAAGRLNPFDGFQLAASPITGDPKQAGPDEARLRRLLPLDSIGLGGGREVKVQPAPMRMIACSWFYDTGTRALFPTDLFGYTIDTPEISVEDAYRNLVARYWWLPGARTKYLLEKLEKALDAHPIEIIAPTHGCVFVGEEVDRQRQILREVLEHAPTDALSHD
jgi:glyoxylase-like metal-dependent hydrolase (beta-lactamase superfamily II)